MPPRRRPRRADGPSALPCRLCDPPASRTLRRRCRRAAELLAARQLHGRAVTEHESDRRAVVAELFAQLVLEVAAVAEVNGRRVRGEEDEGRRRDRGLRGVEELRAMAAHRRWRRPFRRGEQDAVQLARRNPLAALAPDLDRGLKHAPHALTRLGADRQDRREIEERDLVPDPLDVLVERLIRLVLDKFPLVDGNAEPLPPLTT